MFALLLSDRCRIRIHVFQPIKLTLLLLAEGKQTLEQRGQRLKSLTREDAHPEHCRSYREPLAMGSSKSLGKFLVELDTSEFQRQFSVCLVAWGELNGL